MKNVSLITYGITKNQSVLLTPLIKRIWHTSEITHCNDYPQLTEELYKHDVLVCFTTMRFYELDIILDYAAVHQKLTTACIGWNNPSIESSIYIKKYKPHVILFNVQSESELDDCAKAVKNGQSFYSLSVNDVLTNEKEQTMTLVELYERLSFNEKKAFMLMLKGYKQEQIAQTMGVSKGTASTYCSRVLSKGMVDSTLELYRKFSMSDLNM